MSISGLREVSEVVPTARVQVVAQSRHDAEADAEDEHRDGEAEIREARRRCEAL
jgi:hypothetical protein